MRSNRRDWMAWIVCSLIVGAASVGAWGGASPRAVQVPASCPVTIPSQHPFNPPAPYPSSPPFGNNGWIGTPALWTLAPLDGIYRGLRVEGGYRNKLFWWRPGHDGAAELRPDLTLTATRLDAPASPLVVKNATNASAHDLGGWTMLIMPDIPTTGCWRLTGTYKEASVSYVVWVEGSERR